eukprot:SAG31_NODE_2670_length_5271_cov_4.007541_5_plen_102_part_00
MWLAMLAATVTSDECDAELFGVELSAGCLMLSQVLSHDVRQALCSLSTADLQGLLGQLVEVRIVRFVSAIIVRYRPYSSNVMITGDQTMLPRRISISRSLD